MYKELLIYNKDFIENVSARNYNFLLIVTHDITQKRHRELLTTYNAAEASFREYKNHIESYEKKGKKIRGGRQKLQSM